MIGGIVMVLTAIWVYQSMMKAKKPNVLIWVAACAAAFFRGGIRSPDFLHRDY